MRKLAIAIATMGTLAALAGFPMQATAVGAQSLEGLDAQLAKAEAKLESIDRQLAEANGRLSAAKREARQRLTATERAAKGALSARRRVQRLARELKRRRQEAAERIASAEVAYAHTKDTRHRDLIIGLICVAVAVALALAYLVFRRFSERRPHRGPAIGAGAMIAALAVVGAAFLVAAPATGPPPTFSERTRELAKAASKDPLESPNRPLAVATRKKEALTANARRLLDTAQNAVSRAEEIEEEAFKAAATTIDYEQLSSHRYKYIGEKVVYTGRISQISKGSDRTITLAVNYESWGTYYRSGYWFNAIEVVGGPEIKAEKGDIITVYGTVSSPPNGETYYWHPGVKAKYIEE